MQILCGELTYCPAVIYLEGSAVCDGCGTGRNELVRTRLQWHQPSALKAPVTARSVAAVDTRQCQC